MAGASHFVQIDLRPPIRQPKPEWLRAKAPVGENFHSLKKLARGLGLHTVCAVSYTHLDVYKRQEKIRSVQDAIDYIDKHAKVAK